MFLRNCGPVLSNFWTNFFSNTHSIEQRRDTFCESHKTLKSFFILIFYYRKNKYYNSIYCNCSPIIGFTKYLVSTDYSVQITPVILLYEYSV